MKLLLVTQRIDEQHDLLGFLVGWLEQMNRSVELEVVAQSVGRHPFEDRFEVHSLGKEAGVGRWRRLLALESRLVDAIVRRDAVDAVLCHMCPEFVPPAFLAALVRGVPVFLWYTHGTSTWRLRLAHSLCRAVLTASRPGFPFESDKVVPLGHGIDTRKFAPAPLPTGSPPTLVSVGRLSPAKDHAVLIRAIGTLQRERARHVRLRIIGGTPIESQRGYRDSLLGLIAAEGLGDSVELVGSIPYPRVEHPIRAATLFVSASRTDSLDKAVLEAMACGRPVLVSNPAFRGELAGHEERLMFAPGDHRQLAEKLDELLAAPPGELARIGSDLAERVQEHHDLDGFVGRLVEALRARTAADPAERGS